MSDCGHFDGDPDRIPGMPRTLHERGSLLEEDHSTPTPRRRAKQIRALVDLRFRSLRLAHRSAVVVIVSQTASTLTCPVSH